MAKSAAMKKTRVPHHVIADFNLPDEISLGKEVFSDLLKEALGDRASFEGAVVKGEVVEVGDDFVVVDVGLKSEGRIPLKEFGFGDDAPKLQVHDLVDVYVERIEGRTGEAVLSREKARREESWIVMEDMYRKRENVNGVIFGKVKGGFTVDLNGAIAFLPGSQVDIRPIKDINPLMGIMQPFQILKMDRPRGNIVVSRRAVLEETRSETRSQLMAGMAEGQILQGVVKNITDYGAFVDLGGMDGLLHLTDISWHRINHPSEMLSVGQNVEVQVIKFNPETQRISLGMKQLEADPWENAGEVNYNVGDRIKGRVTNVTDYGAFIELQPGIEGLVHASEMSWTKKNVHPGKIVSMSQEVEAVVLEVDVAKRRISLGLKQVQDNPWGEFAEQYPAGSEYTGEIRNITEFGLFVGLPGDIDGMVHLSDLSWEETGDEAVKNYKKGDQITVRILESDPEKERVSLGVKQLSGDDPVKSAVDGLRKGSVVTCTVTKVLEAGIEVSVNDKATGFIKKVDLSRDRAEQRPDRFAVGEKVDAKVTLIEQGGRKLNLSIKAYEMQEEKQAIAEFGSSESGASLGSILGAALKKAQADKDE